MVSVKLNNMLEEFQTSLTEINMMELDDKLNIERLYNIASNIEQNINIIKVMIRHLNTEAREEENKLEPGPNIPAIEYIINNEFINKIILDKLEELQKDHEDNFKDDKTTIFYNSMTSFEKEYYYNTNQLKKLDQILALIDLYLIKPATDTGRYIDTSGAWFIGAGLNVFHRPSWKHKKPQPYCVWSLGYGDGQGKAQKLEDMTNILKHFNIKVLTDHGRMD